MRPDSFVYGTSSFLEEILNFLQHCKSEVTYNAVLVRGDKRFRLTHEEKNKHGELILHAGY